MRDMPVGDLVVVVVVGGIAAVVGVVFGIVLIAPRIRRALDRAEMEEEPRDRPD
jgi:hypothetical protein